MNLELLFLESRRPAETFADLAALEKLPEVRVQIWIDESDSEQVRRVEAALAGDSRFQLFTHAGVLRSERILHAARQARGDLQIELPIGGRLEPRGLAALAELDSGIHFAASPLTQCPEVSKLELEELLDPSRVLPYVAVSPAAVLGHAALRGHPALDVATFFVCRDNDAAVRLREPLIARDAQSSASVAQREASAARRLQVLDALHAAARATQRSGPLTEGELAPLGQAWLDALDSLGAERNAQARSGLFPSWSAPRSELGARR